jgi:hypothetical protein
MVKWSGDATCRSDDEQERNATGAAALTQTADAVSVKRRIERLRRRIVTDTAALARLVPVRIHQVWGDYGKFYDWSNKR